MRTAPGVTAFVIAGIVAGPLYIFMGAIQMAIRPGFDITRHTLSLRSNGELGWLHG